MSISIPFGDPRHPLYGRWPPNSGKSSGRSSIGTNLHRIIKDKTGAEIPCSACLQEITRLNGLNAKQVLAEIETITDNIISRSASNAQKWYHKLIANTIPQLARYEIRRWIKEACRMSQNQISTTSLNWEYGITTVTSRLNTTFPRTLSSLLDAGFDNPTIYVDGLACDNISQYSDWNTPVVPRTSQIKTAKHWTLTLAELFLRNPNADRYAIFQDDFITYRNLRQYLEQTAYPERGYLNLYTFPSNQSICPKGYQGFYMSNQLGRGAVALVFSNEAALTLISSRSLWARAKDPNIADKKIDGGISEAFRQAGWFEYVHNPSLVQHTGLESSMGNTRHPLAKSFLGETYDAMKLLK